MKYLSMVGNWPFNSINLSVMIIIVVNQIGLLRIIRFILG